MKVSFKLWNPSGPANRKRQNTEQSYRMQVLEGYASIMKQGVPVRVSDEVESMGRSADIEKKKTSLSLLDDPVCNFIFM